MVADRNAAFAAQAQLYKQTFMDALKELQEYQALYTHWEPLLICQCQATMKIIREIHHVLEQWDTFFRGPVVGWVYTKETALTIVKLQTLGYLFERGDEAAIAVRSYQPICECETREAFRMQKYARDRLKILINGIQEFVSLMNELFSESGSVTVVEETPLLLPEHKE